MNTIVYNIGHYGPQVISTIPLILLRNEDILLFCYLCGFALNFISNFILKNIFRQPRPNKRTIQTHPDYPLFIQQMNNLDIYGMPSGHTQSATFSTVFVYLATRDFRILVGYLIVTCITMWQRIHYKFHTYTQVLVGGIVGTGMAFGTYYFARKILAGDLSPREDDTMLSLHDTR